MQKNSSRKTVIQMESVGSTHKKHKAKEDIINKLPESLITHILSLLPTKDAVRTSVLSKRWIESWTLVTKLDLDDYNATILRKMKKSKEKQKQCFINFVNRALLLTKSNSAESFSLDITDKYDISLLNTWISCIFKRNVKKLFFSTDFELPFSAYTSHILFNYSDNLEELRLEMQCCSIKVPSSSCYYNCSFGSLKVFQLSGIIFTIDESLGILARTLKKFEMRNCCWLSTNDVTFELNAPLLESVLIEQVLKSMTRYPRSCKIKFSASCMKEFTYCGDGMSQAFILSDPSAAHNTSAKIILRQRGNSVQETGSCVSFLLKQFGQVKFIEFQGSEILTQLDVAALPNFAILSHLELGSVSVEILLALLQKSPVLNTLGFKGISKFDQELLNSAAVPDCLASTLQVVKFGMVRGSEHDLFLAKFFMENGIMLERMSFSGKSLWCKSKLFEEFKEKLYSFKKGVSFAILEFRY